MENTQIGAEKMQYCRICGKRLLEDSVFCDGCGTKVLLAEENHDVHISNTSCNSSPVCNDCTSEYDNSSTGIRRSKNRLIITIILAIILVGCLASFFLIHQISTTIKKQDINTIDGCPEFYNLQFDMTVQEASKLIKIKHDYFPGIEQYKDSLNSVIYFDEEIRFKLYGIPVHDIYCGFDVLNLDSVMIVFSKNKASLQSITDLYTQIYGEPTEKNTLFNTWTGKNTAIDIFDSALLATDNNEIIVRYTMSPNRPYKALTFNGPEYDPCNFLNNTISDKNPNSYIENLEVGEDYDVKKYDLFTEYILYPEFKFMGIEEGMTAVSLSVDSSSSKITLCNYLFLLEKENAADRIQYIKTAIENQFGLFTSCTYTSMKYDELGINDLTFTEFLSKIKSNKQGIYNIQWKNESTKLSLNLTIDPRNEYYDGMVSISK